MILRVCFSYSLKNLPTSNWKKNNWARMWKTAYGISSTPASKVQSWVIEVQVQNRELTIASRKYYSVQLSNCKCWLVNRHLPKFRVKILSVWGFFVLKKDLTLSSFANVYLSWTITAAGRIIRAFPSFLQKNGVIDFINRVNTLNR